MGGVQNGMSVVSRPQTLPQCFHFKFGPTEKWWWWRCPSIWQIWPALYPKGHGGASKELSRPPDWSSPNHINLVTRDWSLPTIMISYLVCVPWKHVRDILLQNCEWRQWLNLKTFGLFVGKFKIKISVRWERPESGILIKHTSEITLVCQDGLIQH